MRGSNIYQVFSPLLPVWPHEVGVGAVALAAHRGRVQPLQDLVQLPLDRAAVGHELILTRILIEICKRCFFDYVEST